MIMNSYYVKSKKIFITFLIVIILISCFSQAFAAINTLKLNVGDKLRFDGTRWNIYKSRTAALSQNTSNITYLERGDIITIKGIFRKHY